MLSQRSSSSRLPPAPVTTLAVWLLSFGAATSSAAALASDVDEQAIPAAPDSDVNGALKMWILSPVPPPRPRMPDAVNMRLLAEEERLGPAPWDPPEVPAVAALICEIHAARPRCGPYCTSTRRDRSQIPSYAETVVREVDCWDYARILVAGHHDYDVPLDVVIATAFQEATFRELAIGRGTECGMFQQTTHHIQWSSRYRRWMARVPFSDQQEICRYLLRLDNAVFHFALKYHHDVARHGAAWPAYYNGGDDMWGYRRRHEAYRARFGEWIDRYLAAHPTRDRAT